MTEGQVVFPLFVRARDSGEIASFHSVHALQFKLEKIDVENQEYEAWDRNGQPVQLKIQEPLWLKVETSNDGGDVAGLRRALLDFASAVGSHFPPDLDINDFEGALKEIRAVQESMKLARSPVRRFLSRLKK